MRMALAGIRALLVVVIFGFRAQCAIQTEILRDPSQAPPAGGGGDSSATILTPDARFLLFASTANNLAGAGTNLSLRATIPAALNVFVRDRSNSVTTLVSVDATGTRGGNDNSWPIGFSTNGRFVLFESSASNLVLNDTNSASDIFVRDILGNSTFLVSSSTNGTVANAASQGSVMTPDGRYVAFWSGANNLTAGDTNGIPDVFVCDLQSGVTTLASVGAMDGPANSVPIESPPSISSDGRYVLFHSRATNLVAAADATNDVYLRDLQLGTTVQASIGARAAVYSVFGASNAVCFNYALSSDGRFAAYETATNFATVGIILRYDRITGATDLIHTNATVTSMTFADSLDITPDGGTIAFIANTNGITNTCVLVWRAQDGTVTLASGDSGNLVSPGSSCDFPRLSIDGGAVAFLSGAGGLVTNNLTGNQHLYLRNLQAGSTTLLDSDTNNAGVLLTSMPAPGLNADGTIAVFEAPDSSLVSLDRNRYFDVFSRDVAGQNTSLESLRDPTQPCVTPNGSSLLSPSAVSTNGRYLAFASDADDLTINLTNGFRNVFLRDQLNGSNLLISVAADGVSPANSIASWPSVSTDGRYVCFLSAATNLVPGTTQRLMNVYLRDTQATNTSLVSVAMSGGPGDKDCSSAIISTNGAYVLFTSSSTTLAPGSFGGTNVFLRDIQGGTTYAVTHWGSPVFSMTPDLRFIFVYSNVVVSPSALYLWDSQVGAYVYTNVISGVSRVAISPDGQRLIYWRTNGINSYNRSTGSTTVITPYQPASKPDLKFSGDGRFLVYATRLNSLIFTNQIYLYDFQTGTNLLVSQSAVNSGPGNRHSDSPNISPDGRYVVYRSFATDIIPADSNGLADIFLFDRVQGTTTLVSASRGGSGTDDGFSFGPVFRPDGQSLLFASWASDLVEGDFNQNRDVFAFSLPGSGTLSPFSVGFMSNSQGSWMTWPANPGAGYKLQYKNSLNDPTWQDLNVSVTIVGNAAFARDSSASASQRFYRVAAH